LVKLFRRRVSIERRFGRAKEWLPQDHLRWRGLEQAFRHTSLSLTTMLTIALTVERQGKPRLIHNIKHYTAQ
jgi:hypothetical protein